jgi:asparagine synthase (glutamine-hydrolysing)
VPAQTRFGKLADVLDQNGRLVDLYQLAYGLFVPGFLRELAPEFAVAGLRSGLEPGRARALERLLEGQPLHHAVSLLELASFVGERLLPDTDAASMAVALEVRVPLLDHRVVECLAGMDLRRRFTPLGRKQLLRDVGLRGLDPNLFERPKQGFVLPIAEWLRRELRDQVGSTLRDAAACEAAGLDAGAVGRLWHSFQSGAPGQYWSRVWALFVLLDWCRRHGVSR